MFAQDRLSCGYYLFSKINHSLFSTKSQCPRLSCIVIQWWIVICLHLRQKRLLNHMRTLNCFWITVIDLSGNYVTTAWKWGWGAQAYANTRLLGPLSLTSMQLWRNYRKGLLELTTNEILLVMQLWRNYRKGLLELTTNEILLVIFAVVTCRFLLAYRRKHY